MDEIFRASEQDWKEITRRATSECVGIPELRDRVAYLETRDRELTGKLQTMQTLSESQRGRLQELSGRLAALEAPVQHSAATEDSSAAEPAPADPDTPQSLHDVALAHVDSLGRSFGILPAILDTIRRAIREPMAAPAGRVATDEELRDAWELAPAPGGIFNSNYCLRAVYNLGRQHGAACPYIRSSDEGTSYCALAEQPAPAAPAPEPAPPAPAGGLVEQEATR
jgi:hypothetical protein